MALLGLVFCLITGCTTTKHPPSEDKPAQSEHRTITAQEAYELMQESTDFILVDVRTPQEYEEGYIEGAILIPDYELAERAKSELPDKTTTIIVYCRSGRRSAASASLLFRLGYQSVLDLGGISSWPYETVKP